MPSIQGLDRVRVISCILLSALVLTGCGTAYVTPGAGVSIHDISDGDVKESFETKPVSPFPARIAVVRVQQAGYYSYCNRGYGNGRFSVVTTRDIESDEDYQHIAALPKVAGVATVNQLLLPTNLNSVRDLRLAVAGLHADLLLVYTINTSFNIKGADLGPLAVVTLGFLPDKEAMVTSTASAALFDVRTGYIYALAESTCQESRIASVWSTQQAIDSTRLETEKKAFAKMLGEFDKAWKQTLDEYDREPTVQ